MGEVLSVTILHEDGRRLQEVEDKISFPNWKCAYGTMNCVISKWQGLLICPGELILACFENTTSSFSCPVPTTKTVKNCTYRILLVQEAFFLVSKKFYCQIGIPFLVAILTVPVSGFWCSLTFKVPPVSSPAHLSDYLRLSFSCMCVSI